MSGTCTCINEDENIVYSTTAAEECNDIETIDGICGNLNVNLLNENITLSDLNNLLLCAFGGAANKLPLVANKISEGLNYLLTKSDGV